MRTSHTTIVVAAGLSVLLSQAGSTQSPAPANWPGLWGPARNGATVAARTPKRFRELWRHRSAGGYSEVVSDGPRAFTMELKDGADYVVAFDAESGRERWRTRIGDTYRGHDGSHDGPISTPSIAGGDLYALGPNGHLVALDAASGKERWRHDLATTFSVKGPAYGFASSPLVEGTLIIVQTGGEKSGGLLAFDRASGRQVWHAPHAKTPAYASAVAATLAGTRQIIAAGGDRTFAVAASDGRLLWSIAGPSAGEEMNNSPQVLPGDRVLLTFWGEAVALGIAKQGENFTASEIWRSPRIRNSMGPTIYKDGFLYGFSGGMLVCADAATGEVKWRHRTYQGSLVGLGEQLLLLGQGSGELRVIRASPDGYTEMLKTTVFTPGATSVTGPSLVGDRIFLRNVEEIVALQIEG